MKKIYLLLFTFIISILSFTDNVVNIYTTRHYNDVDNLIFKEFEKETGIKVNVVLQNNDANLVIQKIKSEGKLTEADVFLNVGFAELYMAKKAGILQKITDKTILNNVPTNFRDTENYYTGISYRARVIVYNPDKVKKEELSTYEDLANAKWKGRILTRSGSSSYNKHLISFMIAKNGEKKTLEWAKKLVSNFARTPQGNDRDQAVAVYDGIGDIAIMNTYYIGKLINDKDAKKSAAGKKLKIFFPNQNDGGTHINIAGAGITKYSKNRENAIKFIRFLTDKKAQEMITNMNYEYPVNPKAELNGLVKSFGTFKPSKISFDNMSKHYSKTVIITGESDWK